MYGDHWHIPYFDKFYNMYFDFVFYDYGFDEPDWRAYITNPIDYRGKPDDGHSTHRLHESDEDFDYICWSEPIRNYRQARIVAEIWADCTSIYINSDYFDSFDDIFRYYFQ